MKVYHHFYILFLRKDLIRQGPRLVVIIGDHQLDYNHNFQIYMHTRDSSPDISADTASLVNIINFTVTKSGLEDQLLGLVISYENPGLEKQKSEMLAKEEALKIQQADLKETLLQELAKSEGNLLENEELLLSLNKTKSQSLQIATTLDESKHAQSKLNVEREIYRKVAQVGSVLYFLIKQLNIINNMYEFSLPGFITLFNQNLHLKKKKNDDHKDQNNDQDQNIHIKQLCRSLSHLIYQYCSRSLFKSDRLMFAFHLIHCLHPSAFNKNEWEYLTGEITMSSNNQQIDIQQQQQQQANDVLFPTWLHKIIIKIICYLYNYFLNLK